MFQCSEVELLALKRLQPLLYAKPNNEMLLIRFHSMVEALSSFHPGISSLTLINTVLNVLLAARDTLFFSRGSIPADKIERVTDWVTQAMEQCVRARPIAQLSTWCRHRLNTFIDSLQVIKAKYLPPVFVSSTDALNEQSWLLQEKIGSTVEELIQAASDNTCAVCLDDNIAKNEDCAVLDSCSHLYCGTCIQKWFKQK